MKRKIKGCVRDLRVSLHCICTIYWSHGNTLDKNTEASHADQCT